LRVLRKSPSKGKNHDDIQSITEEPKYQAKALTVETDTIKETDQQRGQL